MSKLLRFILTLKHDFCHFSVNNRCIASYAFHAKTDISPISVNLVRKPEGVGVRGQGKAAFSHTLRLPLPREQCMRRVTQSAKVKNLKKQYLP